MANTTLTKVIKSTETSNQTVKPGGTCYLHFTIPKAANGISKLVIKLPIACGSGTFTNGSFVTAVGSNLWIYVSYDNGKNYTELTKKVLNPNFNGSLSFTDETNSAKNATAAIVKIHSYPNNDSYGSYRYPDATIKPANITAYTSSSGSDISVSSLSPSGKTLAIKTAQVFSWKVSSPGAVSSQTLYYKLATDSKYTSINVSTGTTSYTFAKSALAQGYYYWYVVVKDTWGYTMTSDKATFTMGSNPTVTIKYPSSNGTIWRSIANTFTWTYKDTLSLAQARYQIQYKLTSASSWTAAVDSSTADTSYTFKANYFANAKYNYRVRVRNSDALWSEWAEITFQAGPVPSISVTSPANNAKLKKSEANTFAWKVSDTLSTGQYAYEIRFRKSASSTYDIDKTVTSSTTQYSLAKNALTSDTYAWQVRYQNNDKIWSSWTDERTITYGGIPSASITSPTDGDNVRLLSDLTITWSYSDTLSLEQSGYELGYKLDTASEYTTLTGGNVQSATIKSGTLSYGTYSFRLRVKNTDSTWSSYQYISILVGSIPTLELTYPLAVTLKIDISQIFTWSLTDTLNTGQKSFELGYKLQSDTDWTTIAGTSENEYYSFESDVFDAGIYDWRVKVTNNDGISTDYVYSTFTGIGETDAPVITNVTQSAIPTLTWTVESQDTFELEIYSNNIRIYSSGVQPGKNVRSFTPNIMIPDGNYVIKIRCMNVYGYFTEWLTYSFILSTVKPEALPIYVYMNDFYGVAIARSLAVTATVIPSTSTSPTPDAYYVMRRIQGDTEWTILGKLSTEDETVKYNDNTAQKGIIYEYALRNYKEEAGYTDSDSVSIMVNHKGALIYDGNDYVNITLSEESQFDISHTPAKNYSYASMIGRTYPVRESSDWLTHSTKISAYVTIEQYYKLEDMLNSNDDLWFKAKDFSFACAIDSITIQAAHLDRGYDISLVVQRVSEEEFLLI